MLVKEHYGEVGFQDALFANFGSCLHHVWEGMIYAGNVPVQFSAGIVIFPQARLQQMCRSKSLTQILPVQFGSSNFKTCFPESKFWPRNAATQHWNNRFPTYRDLDTFSQSDRPNENAIEIEIAPEMSQLQSETLQKVQTLPKSVSECSCIPVTFSNVLWILWGLFDWNPR